jgi:hypothetical protein
MFPKTPQEVAEQILDAVESGREEVLADDMRHQGFRVNAANRRPQILSTDCRAFLPAVGFRELIRNKLGWSRAVHQDLTFSAKE